MRKGKARVVDLGHDGGAGGDAISLIEAGSAELLDVAAELESAVDLEVFEYPDPCEAQSDHELFQVSTVEACPVSLAGEGDQGSWNSCGIFATCGAIHDYIFDHFELDLGEVDAMARMVLSHNITNHEGLPVHDEGTTVRDLIDKLNSANLLWPATNSKGEMILVTFRLKFRSFLTPQEMADAGQPLRYGMVRGSRVGRKGAHGSHLMHAVSFQDRAIMCCNSWGSHHRDVLVPGDLYTEFGRGYLLTLDGVQMKRAAASDWEPALVLPWLHKREWGPWERHLVSLENVLRELQKARKANDSKTKRLLKEQYKVVVGDLKITLQGLAFEAKCRKSLRGIESANSDTLKRGMSRLNRTACELIDGFK